MAIHMRKSATTAGYEPIAEQRLDSQDPNSEAAPPDLKESYYCGLEVPDDHPSPGVTSGVSATTSGPHHCPAFAIR